MASATRPAVRMLPTTRCSTCRSSSAIEEGLFEKAGLDVSFSATYADRERDSAEKPVLSRLKEQMFECGSADSYNVLRVGEHRSPRARQRGGSIAALRARGRGSGHPDLRRKAGRHRATSPTFRGGAGAHGFALHHACRCWRAPWGASTL